MDPDAPILGPGVEVAAMKTEAWLPGVYQEVEWNDVEVPIHVRYKTYVDHDGSWIVDVDVCACDVENTDILTNFKTSWRGARPSDHAGELEMIALTIGNALRHEVKEQLGMKPHGDNA